jgi:hypothetical protein
MNSSSPKNSDVFDMCWQMKSSRESALLMSRDGSNRISAMVDAFHTSDFRSLQKSNEMSSNSNGKYTLRSNANEIQSR